MEYLEAAIRAGAAIGAEYTLVSMGHSGGLPPQERTRRLERSLLPPGRRGTASGHALVVENLTPCESDACTNLASYAALLERLDHPALCGMCDAAALCAGRGPGGLSPAAWGAGCGISIWWDSGMGSARPIWCPARNDAAGAGKLRDIRAAGYDGAATLELVNPLY